MSPPRSTDLRHGRLVKHEKQWWQFWKRRTTSPAMGGEVQLRIRDMFEGAELDQKVLNMLLRERCHVNLSSYEAAIWAPFDARLVADPDNPEDVYVFISRHPFGEKDMREGGNSTLGFWPAGRLAPDVAARWPRRMFPSYYKGFAVEVGMPAKGIYHDGNYRIEIRSPRRPAGRVTTSTRR